MVYLGTWSLCNIGSTYFKLQTGNINIDTVNGVFCGFRATMKLTVVTSLNL